MDPALPAAELTAPPAADVPAVSRACHQRVLEREGIAMFVALHDARPGRRLFVDDPLGRAEGGLLVGLFEHYERGMEGIDDLDVEPDDDPTGAAALIDVLVVLADQHLRARTQAHA